MSTQLSQQIFFSYTEASAKLDMRVKTRTAFSPELPIGTTGTVRRLEETIDGCFLVIRWDLPTLPEHMFSKHLYTSQLVELYN
jgi:hypothetical protein